MFACTLLVSALHLFFQVPSSTCNFILRFLVALLRVATGQQLSDLPNDLRSALRVQGVDPRLRQYICCPKCYALYREDGDTKPIEACIAQELGNRCGARLFRKSRTADGKQKPYRRFFYQSPIQWLARVLQRPGVEEIIDVPRVRDAVGKLQDVWDGNFAKGLQDHDSNDWFFGRPGRYLFVLGVDGFNPNGNRQSGKKKSVGGMYMALGNFPIHLRYKLENICFVGVIPGPHEPSSISGQFNRFLEPLVQDLEQLYSPGVLLTATSKYPSGRLIKAALAFWITDLKAARPIGGFLAATAESMCSVGYCKKSDIHKGCTPLTLRTQQDHKEQSLSWLEAATLDERIRIEKTWGTRGTALAHLPYFDGPRMTCPEGMHLIKNLVEHHLRVLFGLDIKVEDDLGEGLMASGRKFPSQQAYTVAEQALLHRTRKELNGLNARLMEALAYARGLETRGLKQEELRELLAQWVCFSCTPPSYPRKPIHSFVSSESRTAFATKRRTSCRGLLTSHA